ncbi:MAG TPA: ribonuclease PH [Ktedonobacterales bacterium]|nr:ribonuclease PH [Ktedonobacterales bacterium]
MPRVDGRAPDELRPIKVMTDYLHYAEGSVLIEAGATRVLCAASIEDGVPPFLEGRGQGWLTAEYSMLPRATKTRTRRESSVGRPSGRTQEIQRLVGRSLRAALDLKLLGERTLTLDCDVLQADGGTRTLSITGAYIAAHRACTALLKQGLLKGHPVQTAVAAISVGVIDDVPLLDLNYAEDSRAQVDFNVVMTGKGEFVEVQGTAEGRPFSREALDHLLALAEQGIRQLLAIQKANI